MDLLQKKVFRHSKFPEKPKSAVQADFLMKLASLIKEGFSLKEAVLFLHMIMLDESCWIGKAICQLEDGYRFDEILRLHHFPERITSQIYLSLIHGQFDKALAVSGRYLENKAAQTQKLKKLLHYPLLLLIFMIGILMAMRIVLIPSFDQMYDFDAEDTPFLGRFAVGFVYNFPSIIVLGSAIVVLSVLLTRYRMSRIPALRKAALLMKIPFLAPFLRLHYTHFFSYEWSQLMRNGYQMNGIIEIMQANETTRLMQEVAVVMKDTLQSGSSFNESMQSFSFFNKELGMIIQHGEAASRLPNELEIYAADCQKRLEEKIQKYLNCLQPVIFLLIAFLILCIYLALLLPMFTTLKGL